MDDIDQQNSRCRLLPQRVVSLLLVAFVVLMGIQFYRWQGFAATASYYQMKSLMIPLQPTELESMGAICNTLENHDCSVYYFEELVHRFPENKKAFANLGIILARAGKYRNAQVALKRYFRLGGSAYDAMYWMGKSLSNLAQTEKALFWYYKSFSRSPKKTEIASELIDQLMSLGRYEEALSVLASTTKGNPGRDPFWRSKLSGIEKFIIASDEKSKAQRYKIRLPALDGKNHFVPVKNGGLEKRFTFFLLDQRVKDISVTEEFILSMPIHVIQEFQKLKEKRDSGLAFGALRLKLPLLKVGPWELRDIEVAVCKSCQPRIGLDILTKLELSQLQEDTIQFAMLTRR